jgi:hypothetical protein
MVLKYGITGNYYFTSEIKDELIKVCETLNISKERVKFHKKYEIWVLRIKSKKTKILLKEIYYYLL